MPDSFLLYAGLTASAFGAGLINSIAGGGTLLTFPALLAVISPVAANATSTISVLPGTLASTWAYRRDVAHPPKLLLWLIGPSAIGGTLGTWIVTTTEEKIFATLVPWLILAAALLFALQPLVARLLPPTAATIATLSPKRLWALVTVQFVVGVYGGYFGAGMGIMILGALSYMGLRDVHEMNAVKTLLAGIINIAAAVLFIAQDRVGWHYALPMALAAMLGGYAGARLALKIPAAYVRVTVIGIGLATAIYYFLPKAN